MAKVYKKKNLLKRTAEMHLTISFLLLLLFVIYSLFFVAYHLFFTIYVLPVIPILFISLFLLKEHTILRYGYSGENRALKMLTKLDNSFYIFNNIAVSYEGNPGELDFLIVGEKGVFIVEVKNHRGRISGKIDEKKWVQIKFGKSGIPHENLFYNPIKQVKTHVFKLAQELKEIGVDIWIQGIVFFSNPEVELKIEGKTGIPVLKNEEELLNYINKFKIKKTYSQRDTNKILSFLDKK